MRIAVISDLHDDLWADPAIGAVPARRQRLADEAGYTAGNPLGTALADVELLVVAGDLANKARVRWPGAATRLRRAAPGARIHVFPGNHDYYMGAFDDAVLERHAAKLGLAWAQGRTITGRGRDGPFRIICATLWSDYAVAGTPAAAMAEARARMNDHRAIRMPASWCRFLPEDAARAHRHQRAGLEAALSKPFDGRTIVVTHHAPHPCCIPANSAEDGLLAGAYASDLSAIMTGPAAPELWLHGHVHGVGEMHVGDTRVRNVSLGYPDQFGTTPAVRAATAQERRSASGRWSSRPEQGRRPKR